MKKYLSEKEFFLSKYVMPVLGFLFNGLTLLVFSDEARIYFFKHGQHILLNRLEKDIKNEKLKKGDNPLRIEWENDLIVYVFEAEESISLLDKRNGRCIVPGMPYCNRVAKRFKRIYELIIDYNFSK